MSLKGPHTQIPKLLSGKSNGNVRSGLVAQNYVLYFKESSWTPVDNLFELLIPATQHKLKSNVTIQVFENVSGNYELVGLNNTIVNNTGDVTLISSEAFIGKVVIS
jgi:hypothetical protein